MSRQPKGECGERLGKKLDSLIAEIQHEAACESNCCAAPVAVIERPPEPSSEDPPAEANGAMAVRAPDDSAAGGSGFPNPSPLVDDAAWCVAIEADSIDSIGDITPLEHLLSSSSVAERQLQELGLKLAVLVGQSKLKSRELPSAPG